MTAKLFPYGVILILFAVIWLQRSCLKCPAPQEVKSDTVRISVHDTARIDRPVPYEVVKEGKPYPVEVIDTVFDMVREHIDTFAIVQDYFVQRKYSDTARTKYGNMIVSNTVTQNKLFSQAILTNFSIPEVHSVIAAPLKNQFFVGFNVGSNGSTLGFGPSVLLRTKTEAIYGLGASYMPGLDKPLYFCLSSFWKIHL